MPRPKMNEELKSHKLCISLPADVWAELQEAKKPGESTSGVITRHLEKALKIKR
jgi:predicted CopG family antitoxin